MAAPQTHHSSSQNLAEPSAEWLYRDGGATHRRAAAQRHYQRQIADLPPDLVAAYACRVARIWFGVVAAAGGVAMFGLALAQLTLDVMAEHRAAPVWILVVTWGAALLAYAVARTRAVRDVYAELTRIATPSNDPHTDIARMHTYTPVKRTAFLIDRKERASLVWPLVGLTFIGPLSLHGLLALPFASAAGFAEWIQMSALFVGHCHVFAAVFAMKFARQARRVPLDIPILSVVSWKSVFGYTVALAMIPFVLPTVFVAITGVVYFPLAYHWVGRAATYERASILDAAKLNFFGIL